MKLSNYYDSTTENLRVGKMFFHILLLVAIVAMIGWGWKMITRPARTISEVVEQTLDGSNVIYQYEQFFDRYHTIRATAQKIINTQEGLNGLIAGLPKNPADWNFVDKESYSNLNTALIGTKNIFADQIEQYNANARKINRNLFMSDNLPHQIEVDLTDLPRFIATPYGK